MSSNKKLCKICLDIYREAFKEAEPSADFDELLRTGETRKEMFFMKYYLPNNELNEIIKKHCKKHKLRAWETNNITVNINLGAAPNGCRETWEKERMIK